MTTARHAVKSGRRDQVGVRLDRELSEWVGGVATSAGVSHAAVVAAVLRQAKAAGWGVRGPQPASVVVNP